MLPAKALISKGQVIIEDFSYRYNHLHQQLDGCRFSLPEENLKARGA
jgi:hypothetical protein